MDTPVSCQSEPEQVSRLHCIHILGLGSIGLLIAHSLMSLERPPPVTLLFHCPEMARKFERQHKRIHIVHRDTDSEEETYGYDVEVLERDENGSHPLWKHIRHLEVKDLAKQDDSRDSETDMIHSLIVACKGPATVSAIRSVQHRIRAETTTCLMQNGMGQVDELDEKVFSKVQERPSYVLGIISYGLYLRDAFSAVHAGRGTIALGALRRLRPPFDSARRWTDSTAYLLGMLTKAESLGCACFDYQELSQLQLEKLVVNCVLNPVTALLDIQNGQMLDSAALGDLYRELIAEISAVILKLPAVQGDTDACARFSIERLTKRFITVTRTNASNSSSMREDVRNLKETEIDYINGYIVRKGEGLGVSCPMNRLLVQLVKGKTQASQAEIVAME